MPLVRAMPHNQLLTDQICVGHVSDAADCHCCRDVSSLDFRRIGEGRGRRRSFPADRAPFSWVTCPPRPGEGREGRQIKGVASAVFVIHKIPALMQPLRAGT